MPQLLSTRLGPALPSGELVFRAALVERLLVASPKVLLVSAPAGAGKTTSLAQWAAAAARPSVWLRLDAGDNDPVVLVRHLVIAFGEVIEIHASVLGLPEKSFPPLRETDLVAFLESLAAAGPFTFVIDDVHLVSNPTCLEVLNALVDNLPAEATVALGTRAAPALPIARWRVAGWLAEVGMNDLAFDRAEAGALLAGRGIDLEEADLTRLMLVTEGWATGIALASLVARGRPPAVWLPRLHGDQRQIASYLIDEVLRSQPDDVQEFLLRSSILEPLCAASCRVVTGRQDAQAVLNRLARENLFIMPLDGRDEWFHCHRLFADLLQQQLAAQAADEVPVLHSKAAHWCRASGDVPAAVKHLLAAGDIDAAADLVAEGWVGFISQGRYETVLRMIGWFTQEQVLAHGPLTVTCGWVHMADSDPSVAAFWAEAAVRVPMEEAGEGRWGWMRGAQAVLRAVVAESVREMREQAEAAARIIDTPSEQWRQHALLWLGIAQWLCGEAAAASTLEGVARDGRLLNPAGEVMASGILALMAEDEGYWETAATLVDATMSLATALGLAEHRVNGFGLEARARLLAHRGDAEEADACAIVARLVERMPPGTWMGLPGAATLTDLALLRGDIVEAARWSARADAMLARYPEAGIMRDRILRLRKVVARQRLATPLSKAELRVLGLLSTQLSTAEIASRLFVSPATIKTQMQSIYAKLGVNARTPAVECARELGLLPAD